MTNQNEMNTTNTTDTNVPEQTLSERTSLTLVSFCAGRSSRWQFMYNGFKIPVNIKDGALMKIIDNGERFGKGDVIDVQLEIIQNYNPRYKAYENVRFKIKEFYGHSSAIKDISTTLI